MRTRTRSTVVSIGTAVLVVSAVVAACAQDGSAQLASGRGAPEVADTVAVARLLGAVKGVDPLLCELAVRHADQQGSWSRDERSGSPLENDSSAASVLRSLHEEREDAAAVPRLQAALRDPDACVRRVSASLLGRMKHERARRALLSAIDDANPETRQVAALGLGLGEVVDAEPVLVRRLRDDATGVRRAAAWALGALERPTSHTALIEALQRDPDAIVRQTAAWALGQGNE